MRRRVITTEPKRHDWGDKGFFILDGYRWGVRLVGHDLVSYCAGAVPVVAKNTTETRQDTPEVVSKIKSNDNHEVDDSQIQKPVIMKHEEKRGRPRKTTEFSRITKWRRKKELQGVLEL